MDTSNPFEGLDDLEPPAPTTLPASQLTPAASVAPATPTQPAWAPAPQAVKNVRSKKWIWLSAVSVLIVGILGGGYMAYSKGYLAIPGLTPPTDALFDKMVSSITDIQNAQYSVRLNLTSEPRSGNIKPLFEKKNTNGNTNVSLSSQDAQQISNVRQVILALQSAMDTSSDETYPTSLDQSVQTFFGTGTMPKDVYTGNNFDYKRSTDGKHFTINFELKSANTNFGYVAGINVINDTGTVTAASGSTNTSNTNTYQIENVGGQIGLGTANLGDSYLGSLLGLANTDTIFQSIPGDVNLSGGVTIYVEADKQASQANGSIRIDGTYTGGDMSVALDLEARKQNKDVYGIINKFPSFFFIDTSAIKGKWVKLGSSDGTNLISDTMYEQINTQKIIDTLKTSLKNALKEKVFTVKQKLPTEVITGVKSEHYLIAIDPAQLPGLYDTLIAEQQAKGGNTKDLQAIRNELKKSAVMDTLQRIADNSRIEIWVDKVKGFLRQTKWSLVLVPPDGNERLKDKQFVLDLQLTLDKLNQPVTVDIPASTIDLDEATRLLTGISKEDQQAQKQIDRTSELQRVLNAYQKNVGSYPDALDALTPKLRELNTGCKQRAEQRKVNANANTNVTYDYEQDYNCYTYTLYEKKDVNTTDVYSEKAYAYSKDGADFKVTYDLKFSDSDRVSYYKDTYIDGQNTMTSKDVSLEKTTSYENYQLQHPTNTNTNINTNTNTTSAKDSDGDGLTDVAETTVYHTDPNKKDTDGDGLYDGDEVYFFKTDSIKKDSDGDGYTDGQEVASGFNPLGSGKATSDQITAWQQPSKSGRPYVLNLVLKNSQGQIQITWSTNVATTDFVGMNDQTNPSVAKQNFTESGSAKTSHQAIFTTSVGDTYIFSIQSTAGSESGAIPGQTFVAQ